jgi:Fe2+ or Zn2+ uptake regulation protein
MTGTRNSDDQEALRRLLLAALGRARRPLTTAELRDRINAATGGAAHHEAVYRNLLVLENRRRVTRQQLAGRNVTWVLQAPRPPLSARMPRRHPLIAARDAALTETRRPRGTSPTKPTQTGR